MPHKNPLAKKAYYAEYYTKNKDQIRAGVSQYQKQNREALNVARAKRKRQRLKSDTRFRAKWNAYALRKKKEVKAYIREAKNSPCVDCGGSFPYWVMDFDHLRDKKFDIGTYKGGNIRVVQAEILKCELVCANCHRTRTHNRISLCP